MKSLYIIALLAIFFSSCKDESYFYNDTSESVDMSLWDQLAQDSSHSYFVSLVTKYNLRDDINSNNPITLFIPTDEAWKTLDTSSVSVRDLLAYFVTPTMMNIQTMTENGKIQTLLGKFALLEYDASVGSYAYDGATVVESSELYNDGRYYVLDDVVLPAPNLYEYISQNTPIFANYIDALDYEIFDIESSTPIDFSDAGTVYDSVFVTGNYFDEFYFPVGEEYRFTTATFVLFTQEQLDSALEIVKLDLDIDSIPLEWINEIVIPNSISNSIFNNSLLYSDFEEEMQTVTGDYVDVNVSNIDEDSRFICSNGVVFNLSDYVIPTALYKEPKIINGHDAVVVINEGDRWDWDLESVSVTGFEGKEVSPILSQPSSGTLNEDVLSLALGSSFEGGFTLTYTQRGVFPSDKYRLVWSGANTYCGRYKIYINDIPLEMHDWRLTPTTYFDSYEFNNSIVMSVVGGSKYFSKVGNFNQFDFIVPEITEYTDVEIKLEYIGPSLNSSNVVRGDAGLVIDYLKLEIYE